MFLCADASFGYLSLLPNLLRGYGWNPGNRIYEWFGMVIAKKTNDPDITFGEVNMFISLYASEILTSNDTCHIA